MTREIYPNLMPESIELLMASKENDEVHIAAIAVMLDGRAGAPDPALVLANLDRAHMIDDKQLVTPLGAKYGQWCRDWAAKHQEQPDLFAV